MDVHRIGFVGDVHMRQTLPSLANANHVPAHLACTVHNGLNDWIQAWDVTSARQDADLSSREHKFPSLCGFKVAITVLLQSAYVHNVPELGPQNPTFGSSRRRFQIPANVMNAG